jgi:serine protease
MLRFRAGTFGVALVGAAALVLTLKGQSSAARPPLDIQDVGLSAVEEHGTALWSEARSEQRLALERTITGAGDISRVGVFHRTYTPGRVIVRFRDEVAAAERRSIARIASDTAEVLTRGSYADFDVVQIDAAEDPEAVAVALNTQPQVVYAQPAYHVHSTFKPNDPQYDTLQWNLPLIDLEKAWDIQLAQPGCNGSCVASSVTVAVIDTGMAFRTGTLSVNIPAFRFQGRTYPALGPQTIPFAAAPQLVGGTNASRIIAPFDVTSNGLNPPIDLDGHGTHVSGTIGQLTNDGIDTAGIAFNVKLMPIKVLGSLWDVVFGSSQFIGGSDDDVARGIRYAADNGAKVINMSLGSSGPPDCATNSTRLGCSPAIESAIRYAVCTGAKTTSCSGSGVFVVVAGGNEFEDVDPDFGANPTSVLAEIASRIDGAVSVASVDPAKNRSFFSSTGNYIEIAAPGGTSRGFGRGGFVFQQTYDFTLTDTWDASVVPPSQYRAPRFDVLTSIGIVGTSMAAPHISGVAAMLIQQGITDPVAIEKALEASATKLTPATDPCPRGQTPAAGRTCSFGFGLVDARNALHGLGLAR